MESITVKNIRISLKLDKKMLKKKNQCLDVVRIESFVETRNNEELQR